MSRLSSHHSQCRAEDAAGFTAGFAAGFTPLHSASLHLLSYNLSPANLRISTGRNHLSFLASLNCRLPVSWSEEEISKWSQTWRRLAEETKCQGSPLQSELEILKSYPFKPNMHLFSEGSFLIKYLKGFSTQPKRQVVLNLNKYC